MQDISAIPVRAFQDNYIWTLRRGSLAAVVDPGDAQPVLDYLRTENLTLAAIFNTHHHADHVGGNAQLLEHRKVPVYGPRDERIATVSHRVGAGDRIALDEFGVTFEVFEVPGHTRSHIAFYGGGMLFCGDTLFACGCGRLFEGTPLQMRDSLAALAALPDDTRVYCGHEYTLSNIRFAKLVDASNPRLDVWETAASAQRAAHQPTLPSTIGAEKAANPFLRCNEPAVIEAASRYAASPLADEVAVLGAIREWKNKS